MPSLNVVCFVSMFLASFFLTPKRPLDQGILARVPLLLVSSLFLFPAFYWPYGFSIPRAIFGQSLLPATYHAVDPRTTLSLLSLSVLEDLRMSCSEQIYTPFLTKVAAHLVAFWDELAPNMQLKVCLNGHLACGCFPSVDVLGNTCLDSDRTDVAGPSDGLPTFPGGTGISTSTSYSASSTTVIFLFGI